jgi:hypothetical protein
VMALARGKRSISRIYLACAMALISVWVYRSGHLVRQPLPYRDWIPGLTITKWLGACSCTSGRRAAIGWIDLRFPLSINPADSTHPVPATLPGPTTRTHPP